MAKAFLGSVLSPVCSRKARSSDRTALMRLPYAEGYKGQPQPKILTDDESPAAFVLVTSEIVPPVIRTELTAVLVLSAT